MVDTLECSRTFKSALSITRRIIYRKRFPRNSEADASEFHENLPAADGRWLAINKSMNEEYHKNHPTSNE